MSENILTLTPLGQLVRLHTCVTPIRFWTEQLSEAEKIADEDGDWEFFFEEKIRGLTEMRDPLL